VRFCRCHPEPRSPSPRVAAALAACGGPRRASIVALSVAALWPLCSLTSLAALAPTSALGTAGVLYTALFMGKRCADGAYAAGGQFCARGAAPAFGATLGLASPRLGVFVAMCGTAYMAHFNAPAFFEDAGRDVKTFKKVVRNGFAGALLLNVAIMAAGFLTFGRTSLGLILNNYATNDAGAVVARALFGSSVVFTFPLIYSALKIGARSMVPVKNERTREKLVVALPLALITAMALFLEDVGIVVALTGSLMGSAIIYILPALMLLKGDKTPRAPIEKKLVPLAMIALGAASGALGVATTLA